MVILRSQLALWPCLRAVGVSYSRPALAWEPFRPVGLRTKNLYEIAVFFAVNRSNPSRLTDRNPEFGDFGAGPYGTRPEQRRRLTVAAAPSRGGQRVALDGADG